MDVKQAVQRAKEYLADLFADQGIANLALEEIEYDELHNHWIVTLGFERDLNQTSPTFTEVLSRAGHLRRIYKIVRVNDESGEVISIKNREVHPA